MLEGKYDYVLIRPVSYIQKYIDPSFKTVIGTPPFPAYTSGHSCEMGAGPEYLQSYLQTVADIILSLITANYNTDIQPEAFKISMRWLKNVQSAGYMVESTILLIMKKGFK